MIRSDEGLTLETSAFQIVHGGYSTFINSFDKINFSFVYLPYVNVLHFLDKDDRKSSKRRNLSALVFLINLTTKVILIRIVIFNLRLAFNRLLNNWPRMISC